MKTLWFVVPVHGRLRLASICLRQLARTCESLRREGVGASAVVVASREDHQQLPDLGFASVNQRDDFLGSKFNDGIQLATDPQFNPRPVDYVVPCGSDDWVDHRLFLEPLPDPATIQGFQRMSFVREDGSEMVAAFLRYEGGAGIRIIPRQLVEPLGYRPADEDRRSGCDTSILFNLRAHHGDNLKVKHFHLHDQQIVDWKTPDTQLNSFDNVTRIHRSGEQLDPFSALVGIYPAAALRDMQRHYLRERT